MAAPAIAVERYRVEHGEGFTMPVVSLTDRRAAGNRIVRFVFQRHLETVLYGRSEGSSGPIWKVIPPASIGWGYAKSMAVLEQNAKSARRANFGQNTKRSPALSVSVKKPCQRARQKSWSPLRH